MIRNRRLYILQRGRQRRLCGKIYRQYRDTNHRCYIPYKRQDQGKEIYSLFSKLHKHLCAASVSRKAVLYGCRGRTHSGSVNRYKTRFRLPPDIIGLLDELNKIKPVFVELGLQTSNEAAGKLIRRAIRCVFMTKQYISLKASA